MCSLAWERHCEVLTTIAVYTKLSIVSKEQEETREPKDDAKMHVVVHGVASMSDRLF